MPFQEGNTLGRGAPKKTKSWSAAIERAVYRMENDDPQALEKLAMKLVLKASEGDISALKEVGDRLEGKALQQIEIKKADPFDDITPDDITRIRDRLTGRGALILDQAPRQSLEVQETRDVQTVHKATRIP